MDIQLHPGRHQVNLEGYGDGYFKISGKKILPPILLFPTKYIQNGKNLEKIRTQIEKYSKKHTIDLIIYGNTNGLFLPDVRVQDCLKSLGIPLEIMNTEAACRTWSVLIGEGRSVCAYIV